MGIEIKIMKVKQIYHPYWKWEDYLNGMWRKETKEYEEINFEAINYSREIILIMEVLCLKLLKIGIMHVNIIYQIYQLIEKLG